MSTHNQQVVAFFEQCRQHDPEQFKSVCEKYPTLSVRRLTRIRHTEIPKGLLGLQPVRGTSEITNKYGFPVREGE